MRVLFIACLLCMFSTAQAKLITIDPDNFASGEDISHATAGVTLSTYFKEAGVSPPQFGPMYAVSCEDCSTGAFNGENVFGSAPEGPGFADAVRVLNTDTPYYRYLTFRADFLNPTNYVQILGGASGSTELAVFAFDSENRPVGSCVAGGGGYSTPGCDFILGLPTPGHSPTRHDPWGLTINTGSFNISYIIAGGFDGGSNVKSLSFVAVPEPSSWPLLAMGLILILVAQRKRCSPESLSLR